MKFLIYKNAVILHFFEKIEKNNADMDVTCKFNIYLEKAEFYADFRMVEMLQKNALTKSYKETNLTNMSKSGKSTFIHHIFVNNFLCVNFFATFSLVLKAA